MQWTCRETGSLYFVRDMQHINVSLLRVIPEIHHNLTMTALRKCWWWSPTISCWYLCPCLFRWLAFEFEKTWRNSPGILTHVWGIYLKVAATKSFFDNAFLYNVIINISKVYHIRRMGSVLEYALHFSRTPVEVNLFCCFFGEYFKMHCGKKTFCYTEKSGAKMAKVEPFFP